MSRSQRPALSWVSSRVVVPALLVLAHAPAPAAPQDVVPARPSDEEVLRAFRALDEGLRLEAVEWFSAECERLPTLQRRLVDHVLKGLDQPVFDWPAAAPPPVFDPKVHAPAQPIPRRIVDTTRPPHDAVVERMLRKVPERPLVLAHEYDWARGTVVRCGEHLDPERVARNAVLGLEPRVDLVEAIVTRTLDDGAHRREAEAFGHVYADREGNAYAELTLYDAWSSGANMEMPDVEVLGIVHTLLDDWRTWTAPVPGTQHRKLYARVGELYLPYHRARALRTALARTYLLADPVLRDGYGPAVGRLHAFWERAESDPGALASTLPAGGEVTEWLAVEGEKVDTDLELWQRAEARRRTLREDQERVRRTFVGILRELGAL